MNAIDCIKGRRSIRTFTEEPVSHETIEEIVDIARFSPSWKNTQISRYVVVEGAVKDEICKTCFSVYPGNGEMVSKAPMLVVLTYIKNRSGFERDGSYTTVKEDRWQNFDTGIAAQSFCLAAYEKGLGTVILGIFDDDKIAKLIDLPEDRGISALIVVGHPAVAPEAPKRKEVADLVTYVK